MAQRVLDASDTAEPRLTMTYDAFLAWAGEEIRAEWVDGEVIVLDMPKPIHQDIAFLFARVLAFIVDLRGAGTVLIAPCEMLVRGGRSSREPDVMFVASANQHRITADRVDGPADLVLEVISGSSTTRDRRDKLTEYEAAGVGEYWMIDSRGDRRDVTPFSRTSEGRFAPILPDGDGRLHSAVLPGFWIDPAWFRQDPLPDPLNLVATMAPDALLAAVNRAMSTGATAPRR